MELRKREHGHQNQRHMSSSATENEMDDEQQDEVLIFPEGERDAVTITRNDMKGLQAGGSLNGNVIDFYNKYLQNRLRPTIKDNVHIFNTYFFTKLVQIGGLPEEQRDAAYKEMQRLARNANMFEKKFVFIPVFQSSHWSLIIICYLNNLANAPDKQECPPRILHLDSVKGKHKNLEEHIIKYIFYALVDRYQNLNVNQLVALRGRIYVELKVPQQENQYDCGIYLLCFIELFLRASLNVDFVPNQESLFTSLERTDEVSAKRRYIKDLIWELRLKFRRKSLERKTGLSELYDGRPVSQICDDLETNLDGIVFVSVGRTEDLQMHYLEQLNTEVDETEFQDYQISVEVALDNQQHTETEHSENRSTGESMLDDQQQCQQLAGVPLEPRKKRRKSCRTERCDLDETDDCVSEGSTKYVTLRDLEQIDVEVDDTELLDYRNPIEVALDNQQHTETERSENPSTDENMLDGQHQCQQLECAVPLEPGKKRRKRCRNWSHDETRILLACMKEGGRFCHVEQATSNWDAISREIAQERPGTGRTAKECRLRYDTLLKAYKKCKDAMDHCTRTGKQFSELQQGGLKLATRLRGDWYRAIDEICERSPQKARPSKDVKLYIPSGEDAGREQTVGIEAADRGRG